MLENNPSTQTNPYKSGFVTILGRPNVGKSTLLNALLEQKIAAVSPKPQTTRKRQAGILTLENTQIIFEDTPGVHFPHHKLGEYMNREALHTLEGSDVVLFVVDVSHPPHDEDVQLAEVLRDVRCPILLVLNKVDLLEGRPALNAQVYQDLLPNASSLTVSALQPETLQALIHAISEALPAHPPFFPEEQVTDWYERDIAADLIREAALALLMHEVPHSIAVRVDEYAERSEQAAYVAATLFVEKESQKGIVIGKGGLMLKEIGTLARHSIEAMSGRKVFLELRVKVRKNWRDDDGVLKSFGFQG